MTFEAFKKEIIERIRTTEFNQFLFLYIKAKTWSDILKAFKLNGYYGWSFSTGIVDFNLLNEIPEVERESESIFNRHISLENTNGLIYLLNDGFLQLHQNDDFRTKIYMFGKSEAQIKLHENSMIDIEQFHDSKIDIHLKDSSFLHSTQQDKTVSDIRAHGFTTIKLNLNDYSISDVNLYDDAYLNANTMWFSEININTNQNIANNTKLSYIEPNFKVINKDKSKIILKDD